MPSWAADNLSMSERPPKVLPDPMTRGVHSSLRVPADLAVVGFVRSALACVLIREGWPSDGAWRVLLASSEALTNAIEHGSPLGGAVDVEISVTTERTRLRVTDEGRPGVSTPRLPVAPPPSTSLRGRGLLIISRLADDVDLAAHGSGTALTVGFVRAPVAIVAGPAVRAARTPPSGVSPTIHAALTGASASIGDDRMPTRAERQCG